MLFHTWVFFVFFIVVYLVYLPLRHTRWYTHWLLAASYVFYGWWNWYYLFLILFATAVNFLAVQMMERSRRPKCWLFFSIFNSLAVLGFFKYTRWVLETANALVGWAGLNWTIPIPEQILGWEFVLPVGISFFTFQAMSYTIDYYRGKIEREPSFIRYAAFVSLFPQLVAGPIERAGHLLKQMYGTPEITYERIADGISLFLVGLFKKLVIADYLATYVDQVYAAPDLFNRGALLAATFAFGFQIYCDFSGYTDMARGVARVMGFDLMLNFKNPYAAKDLGDFWRRWHISLSTWFRDYVYIPLGGNRRSSVRTYMNIAATLVISAIWHGAAWTFVIWGVLHAVGRLVSIPLLEKSAFYREKIPTLIKQFWVFLFVMLTWVFFRASTVGEAWEVLRRIAVRTWGDWQFPPLMLIMCAGLLIHQIVSEMPRWRAFLTTGPVRMVGAVSMVLFVIFFAIGEGDAFIYFQF